MLFGPYFHEKIWSAASYCLLKVTKPAESLKIEAKYAKVCFLRQGLIPGLLHGSHVSQTLDHQGSDKNGARWKKNEFKFAILFVHFPYISQPLQSDKCQGLGPDLTENMIFIPASIWLKASSSSFIALRNRDLRVFELKPG